MRIKNWFNRKNTTASQRKEIIFNWDDYSSIPEGEHLFASCSNKDILEGLEAWDWLDISHLKVSAITAFGEPILTDANGILFHLDTIEGKLNKIADNRATLLKTLNSEESRDHIFLAGFVIAARSKGLILNPNECYDFKILPALGGPMNIDYIEKRPISIKLHITGQIHEQIKDLPPGTHISEISIN